MDPLDFWHVGCTTQISSTTPPAGCAIVFSGNCTGCMSVPAPCTAHFGVKGAPFGEHPVCVSLREYCYVQSTPWPPHRRSSHAMVPRRTLASILNVFRVTWQ